MSIKKGDKQELFNKIGHVQNNAFELNCWTEIMLSYIEKIDEDRAVNLGLLASLINEKCAKIFDDLDSFWQDLYKIL